MLEILLIAGIVSGIIALGWWLTTSFLEERRIDAFNESRYHESAEYIRDQIRAREEGVKAEEMRRRERQRREEMLTIREAAEQERQRIDRQRRLREERHRKQREFAKELAKFRELHTPLLEILALIVDTATHGSSPAEAQRFSLLMTHLSREAGPSQSSRSVPVRRHRRLCGAVADAGKP